MLNTGNNEMISSLHDLGTQANRLLQQARKQTADLLNVKTNEVFFITYVSSADG
jgi:cysteine desulfurase